MEERHDFLYKTIGVLEMEQEALDRGRMIRNWSFAAILIGGILEGLFFFLYNNPCHPFANILKDPETPEEQGKPFMICSFTQS